MFKDIVWSSNCCTLKTFIDSYHLPQVVQVESGVYNEDEAKTLSAEQILTLHYTKQTDKVLAKAAEKKPFFIPVNFPCKVEILPTICQDRYYSVHDVVDASSVKFIRVIHDSPPSLGLKAGDILELKKTVEQNREKFIECEFHDKTRDLVRLPLEFKAAFDPLARVGEYHFQEVLNTFKLPVRVKFTSSDAKIRDVNHDIDLLSFDSVLLKEIHEESTIIATSRADNTVTVVMFPTDLDVSVYPAEGAITGDKTYARFCRDIHDGADLEKVDLSLANVVRLVDEPNVEVLYDYIEVKPPVPPRGSAISQAESNDDPHDDYVVIPLPPPRPPKSKNLREPPLSPTHAPLQRPQPVDHCKDYKDGHDDLDTEYLYPEESEIPSNTPPSISAERKPPQQHLERDREPPLPVRKESLFQGHLKTAGYSASTNYYNVQSDRNPHGQTSEPDTLEKDSDFDDSDDDDDDDDDNDDNDDNDWDSDDSNEYLYPEYPAPEFVNSETTSNATQAGPTPKSPLKKIFSLRDVFKKTTPKSSRAADRKPVPSQRPSAPRIPVKSPISPSPLDFPDDLGCLSVTEIGDCLRKLNLEKHVDRFTSNQIDGELFLILDKEKLSSLGVTSAFEQTKLLKFIHSDWRPNTK